MSLTVLIVKFWGLVSFILGRNVTVIMEGSNDLTQICIHVVSELLLAYPIFQNFWHFL